MPNDPGATLISGATSIPESRVIKTFGRIRFSSNQNIGEGESNFGEKNVERMIIVAFGKEILL